MSWPLCSTRQLVVPRGLSSRNQSGNCSTLLIIVFIQSILNSAAATTFLAPEGKRRSALQVGKGPEFWRNEGVRGGVQEEWMGMLGDSGAATDSLLDSNWVTGSSSAYDFRSLDNLEPIAPMDSLVTAQGRGGGAGMALNPVYIPKYLHPDAFPVVVGDGCNCTMGNASTNTNITCACTNTSMPSYIPQVDHYTWLKDEPIVGTNQFTLKPADLTYRQGDYWQPDTIGGLVAPADALPARNYPNQAPASRIWPIPAAADETRIAVRYARYLDQVQDRSEGSNNIEDKFTTKCRPGDAVVVETGNLKFPATIIKTFVGNVVQIEFVPPPGKETESTDCPVEAGCTAFRYCKSVTESKCTQLKDKKWHNWNYMLFRDYVCPSGTKVCAKVNQLVLANTVRKGEKWCEAAPTSVPSKKSSYGQSGNGQTGPKNGIPPPPLRNHAP